MRIVLITHYYPPINSSGAKRAEALSKYFAAMGHDVTVIATRKSSSDGGFTEATPAGVKLLELDALGRLRPSEENGTRFEPMYVGQPSLKRRAKDWVMRGLGQLPDPRLPFALSFLVPWLAPKVRRALSDADVVIGTSPPWPMLLAALIIKRRFGTACILDYRDHFSECHEMPGGPLAKWLEKKVDSLLVQYADKIVTISEPMTTYYRTMAPNVETILNGYDPELLAEARLAAAPAGSNHIFIRYMGIVSPGRVPRHFLNALVRLAELHPEKFARIRVEFFGNASLIEQELIREYTSIAGAFDFHPAVPYRLSLQRIIEADYLLFSETSSQATLSAQGILTTKLFEYIGSGRPILADISPKTLAGSLLIRSKSNNVVSDNTEDFVSALASDSFYQRCPDEIPEVAASLSRRSQAEQYALIAQSVARPRTYV